jgi:hypothetical protein
MSTHYANLEWAVNDRRMDLPDLRKETEDALQSAHGDADAQAAFKNFLNSFGDGHLHIEWPVTDKETPKAASNALCERLGYHPRGKPGLDYSLISGLAPLNSEAATLFP